MQKTNNNQITGTNEKHPFNNGKALVVFGMSIIIFSLVLVLAFLGYEKVYAQKFYPGVRIAGNEIGGMTSKKAKDLVDTQIKNISSQKLNLTANETNLSPTMDELGISFDSQEIVDDAYQIGRGNEPWNNFLDIIEAVFTSKDVSYHTKIDSDKFNSYIAAHSDLNKSAKDASLKVENGEVVVVLSEEGNNVDMGEFAKNLESSISKNEVGSQIILKTDQIKPSINENQVIAIKSEVEKVVGQPITMNSDKNTFAADSSTIAGWIILKSGGNGTLQVQFSDDKIQEFINSISRKTDQKKVDKQINDQTGAVITEGNDGLELNQTKLLNDIKMVLSNPTSSSRIITLEINTVARGEKRIQSQDIAQNGGTPGLYDGKYIEINLSEQKMYAYEGTNLVGAYTVSTGKWSTPTPIGTRYIESKDDRAYSGKYNLYMPWWNSLGGGYGIHELPEWANGTKEGENHLGTPVSHGCIRLGVGPAEFIYNWAPIGTPVYIHK